MPAKAAEDEPPDIHPKRVAYPNAKRPSHQIKEYDALIKAAWKANWWCERRRKYIFCLALDLARTTVKVPSTPSGGRTLENVKRNFRAAGLPL